MMLHYKTLVQQIILCTAIGVQWLNDYAYNQWTVEEISSRLLPNFFLTQVKISYTIHMKVENVEDPIWFHGMVEVSK